MGEAHDTPDDALAPAGARVDHLWCPGRRRPRPAADPGLAAAYVEGIQRQLLELGFNPGRNDGRLGGQTNAAIRAYQKKAGLAVDGCPTQGLLDHMSFTQPRVTAGRVVAAPTPVQEAQQALTSRGYYLGPVDGRDGPKTRAAVLAFQRDKRLPETGVVDSELLRALKAPRK